MLRVLRRAPEALEALRHLELSEDGSAENLEYGSERHLVRVAKESVIFQKLGVPLVPDARIMAVLANHTRAGLAGNSLLSLHPLLPQHHLLGVETKDTVGSELLESRRVLDAYFCSGRAIILDAVTSLESLSTRLVHIPFFVKRVPGGVALLKGLQSLKAISIERAQECFETVSCNLTAVKALWILLFLPSLQKADLSFTIWDKDGKFFDQHSELWGMYGSSKFQSNVKDLALRFHSSRPTKDMGSQATRERERVLKTILLCPSSLDHLSLEVYRAGSSPDLIGSDFISILKSSYSTLSTLDLKWVCSRPNATEMLRLLNFKNIKKLMIDALWMVGLEAAIDRRQDVIDSQIFKNSPIEEIWLTQVDCAPDHFSAEAVLATCLSRSPKFKTLKKIYTRRDQDVEQNIARVRGRAKLAKVAEEDGIELIVID